MSGISGTLSLNDDVIITAVSELSEELREQAECKPGQFAISRTRGRGGSSIIDADSARLLDRFREPRTIVEAVILYAREKAADATEVLESAYPFLKGMVQRQVLVASNGERPSTQESSTAWGPRTRLPIGEVVRALQVLDDSAVYLIARPNGERAVLKIERPQNAPTKVEDPARLRHEARVLAYLDGRVGPRLLDEGQLDGRYYLVIELLQGIEATTALREQREQFGDSWQRGSLDIARSVCDAYEELHSLGVIHGDVHPRNVLVLRDGSVRLIDFGFASGIAEGAAIPRITERGGIPFFFEPEFARAALNNSAPPPPAAAGEQFAIAALIFYLTTGEYWQRFRLGRDEMLRDIAEGSPRSFADCGCEPWPELERILSRALSRNPMDRWPSMTDLASAFDRLSVPTIKHRGTGTKLESHRYDRPLLQIAVDGPLIRAELPAPSVSINYGSAGIALAALHVAQRRAAPEYLAVAEAWLSKSLRNTESARAYYNAEIDITREMVGQASPYHSPSGVHAVDALIARASGNGTRQNRAVGNFIECARRPAAGLDLTLGRASTLLGAAILFDALPQSETAVEATLREFGTQTMDAIWTELDKAPRVGEGSIDYLGIAHGWAGFLYATLMWCGVTNTPVPIDVQRRLDELAALAMPAGRGLEWAWVLGRPGDPPTMSGWCNGSCGYVFLWTLAHKVFHESRYLDVAMGAAWNSWESQDPAATLCCGLAGRGYALLNLYRHTQDDRWLARAHSLCARGAAQDASQQEYPHSLYKGDLGIAVLAADLEDPEWGRMPFFEPAGYRV